MTTPFENKRLGRVLLSEAFVTGNRAREVFEKFSVLLAMPRYNEPGIIAYYGAHPDFEKFDGVPKDSPYYDPYWNKDGFYFKRKVQPSDMIELPIDFTFAIWMKELDQLFLANLSMGRDDFEDYDWRAEYDGENTPEDAFQEWGMLNGIPGMN